MQTQDLVDRVCREFTRATGWPLRYESGEGEGSGCAAVSATSDGGSSGAVATVSGPARTRARRPAHQETSWRVDLRDGHQQAGILRIDRPTKKRPDREFLQACNLADVIAEILARVVTGEAIERTETDLNTTSPDTLPQTLTKVLDNGLKLTGLRSAGFFLLSADGQSLRIRSQKHRDAQVIPSPRRQIADSPLDRQALSDGTVLIRRGEGDHDLWLPESCKLGLVTPVRTSTDPVGTLWAFDRRSRRLSPRDMHVFESVSARIGHLLEHAVLRRESLDKQRLSSEMAAAYGNKPTEVLDATLCDGAIGISSRCLSCTELGGDMSEIITEGDQAMIGLGDASGHSLPAAIVMSVVRGAFRALCAETHGRIESDEMMSRINRALVGTSQSHQFMTMVCGHLNGATRELTFTNAGHPQPVLYRDGGVTMLDSDGMLLGVMDSADYGKQRVQLRPGDVLAIYTDGISESSDEGRRMFKPEGVAASVCRHADLSAAEIRDRIWQDVEDHLAGQPCDDDRTVLVLKVAR